MLLIALGSAGQALACGGFFCQNTPVNQVGERIVFQVNDDDTITSLIQIQYQGEADDFSWILPIPEAITADDLKVTEEGDQIFTDLHNLTDVQFINPPLPECAQTVVRSMAMEDSAESAEVEVFASGEVGPFGFDVIGSTDPDALTTWLRDNNYRVDPSMEPLINVYVEDQFAFIAMRLLDGQDTDSITPIEITYPGTRAMIPLRLTAVAALDDMPVFAWIFAEDQVVPTNFEHMEIATEEITFNSFGGNNYVPLVQQRADALGGRAFITEFAGPATSLDIEINQYLRDAAIDHPYLTRLTTYISPDEMTVDPVFAVETGRQDVSNVRDASNLTGLYDCEREQPSEAGLFGEPAVTDAIEPRDPATNEVAATTPPERSSGGRGNRPLFALIGVGVLGGLAFTSYRAGQASKN